MCSVEVSLIVHIIYYFPFNLKKIVFINYFQVQKNSKVYRRLSEVLGLSEDSMVLSVFIRKM